MNFEIEYRLLTADDAGSYHSIRLECLKNHPDNFGDTLKEELELHISRFTGELSDGNSTGFWFGAFNKNRLVGITGFVQQKRTKTKHRGDLIQVYTSPDFINRGIATNLIRLTIEKAFQDPSIEQIMLSVVYSNDKAISLYRKFGFVQYGFIKDYFKSDSTYSSQLFMSLSRCHWEDINRLHKEQAFHKFAVKLSLLMK